MKKYSIIIIAFCFILSNSAYSQEKSFHSLQEALDYHITQLKSNLSHYNNIYVVTSIDENIKLSDHVFQVENSINPKFLRKNDQNFLVKLLIYTRANDVKIDAVNYKIVKHSNKKMDLLNLSNGGTYIIK